jgi:RNase P subunit RPR2
MLTRKLFIVLYLCRIEDGHSFRETPVPFPNTEVKPVASVALVSDKRRSTDAVFVIFMKKKLSRNEVREKIDEFFRQKDLDPKYVKKIKRLAMKYNIKLGVYRRLFCKKCFSDLRDGSVRVTKSYKSVTCKCGERTKWKITK